MRYTPLAVVKNRITVGAPLPFNVYSADETLLLARGRTLESGAQLQALFSRGTLVDLAELHRSAEAVRKAPVALLPAMWNDGLDRVARALRQTNAQTFGAALDEAAEPVAALIDRDPDLAIFQVLRQQGNEHVQYGVNHSMHAAITSSLVAQRLGWSSDDAQRAFKTALTMNLSMLELQGQLALQTSPPSPDQRAAIQAHPAFSRTLLEMSGVTDSDWLTAVEQHHEAPDGSGYPHGLRVCSDLAALVRRVDIYTAKLSPRATRRAVDADKAGRTMFMQEPSHPMVLAMVKEFGVYPPGCMVRLVSGESGLVVRRGPTVTTPIVAAMNSPTGASLSQPLRRDTSQREHAVHSVLAPNAGKMRIAPEVLMALAAA